VGIDPKPKRVEVVEKAKYDAGKEEENLNEEVR